jgi:outer membrane lipoprotein-sorting protein
MLASLLIIMAACGGKSQEGVVKKIEGKMHEVNGYKVSAEMTMKTGKEDRNYDVDVWYKKGEKDFYRVGLDNEEEKGNQVILKNEEGVFVLTPALKKSFKFQTDWPENSSQPYLYQSIVQDVLADKEATFTEEENHYKFFTKTNYQNNTNLLYQEVYFDKKTFTPTSVKVLDKDKQVLIEVAFTNMEIDPVFDKNDFQRDAILENTLADESVTNMQGQTLAVMFPLETLGAELAERKEINLENGERVIMTFKGEKNFTLIQEKEEVVPTMASVQEMTGDIINLGHSVGAISDQTIEWNYEGTNFVLASEDMTIEEMVEVASSIEGKEIK